MYYLLMVLTRKGLKQMVIGNVIFGYVGVGFVATQIALFAECRPFAQEILSLKELRYSD